jgi:hypothetical protein
MKYFHRTSLPIDDVLAAADRFFDGRLERTSAGEGWRTYGGTPGAVTVSVRAEGGHYTLVQVATDQVGESEADKLAKRFLAVAHARAHEGHIVRGAY